MAFGLDPYMSRKQGFRVFSWAL